jgi:hypothetical protein
MTTYYVGSGGDNGNNGTTWALRKATLNGAEDIPVAANDTVYVGPGTYRESLTVDVSGAAGQPITYIGDYSGTNTDGVGGVVRITGSDNDQSATRASCITASSKNYRTFRGFHMGLTTGTVMALTSPANWIIEQCVLAEWVARVKGIQPTGADQLAVTIRNCAFLNIGDSGIYFSHNPAVDNAGHVVENCLFTGARDRAIGTERVGGITIKNCTILSVGAGVQVTAALTAGQTVTVNNCIIHRAIEPLKATSLGELVEDYNAISSAGGTDRTNVAVGANSNTYPLIPDTRWFFEAVGGGGILSPWDMASYCQLVNVAGTSPTTTDMRGTSVQGAQREWGALEYDSTLEIEGGGGGSANPLHGKLG